jgi:hypothetical protein
MRTPRVVGGIAAAALAALTVSAGGVLMAAPAHSVARPGASAPTWGGARELPGLASLNASENASISSVSCASASNCGAGGFYTDAHGQVQPFVAAAHGGRWKTIEVPAIGLANAGTSQTVTVSCPSASNCSAGGFYTDDSRHSHGFVVTERNGTWSDGEQVPGLQTLSPGNAAVESVSCLTAGNCIASGFYTDRDHHQQGYAVLERNGHWDTAEEVPGLARLNAGGNAGADTTSCAAGSCTVAGWYADSHGRLQGFLATERGGHWSGAAPVPGLAQLNRGGNASVISVSCATATSCSATGVYRDAHAHSQSFVASRRTSRWGSAVEIGGLARLNVGGTSQPAGVSCWSAGNCSVGGAYANAAHQLQAFVVTELGYRWGRATPLPSLHQLDSGGLAIINSVSCAQATCAAGGFYQLGATTRAFVVSGRNGRWGTAEPVPGLVRLNTGEDAGVDSISCAAASRCTAVGTYQVHTNSDTQGFVVSQG